MQVGPPSPVSAGKTAATAFAALVLTAALAAGCTFSDVTLQAPQRFDVATGSHRGQGREIVLVRPFRDGRNEARCGMKKNGYNMDSASVLCAAPASMIADVIANHLALAGFRVLRDRRNASPSAIILTGALDQVFVEAKNNFFNIEVETDVALKLRATTTYGLSAERRFYVKGDEATVFGGDDAMQASFDSAVRQLAAGVVGAMANLAERFPPPPSVAPAAPSPPASASPPEGPAVEPSIDLEDTN
jgi:hypothetical protein